MARADMRPTALVFKVLGPLEAWRGSEKLPLSGRRLRALLALLLIHANRVVSRDRLIDELFGEEPPEKAENALQAGISRLRRALTGGVSSDEGDLISTQAPGYVLRVEDGQLDLLQFESLIARGRAELEAQSERAGQTLRDALALWRGEAFADIDGYPFARAEAARLEDLRLSALMDRLDADLAVGRHAGVVSELETLVAAHPLQERLRGQLMLALYRSGRQADALAAYHDARRMLVNELGIEPGRALRELERAILAQDSTLEAPARFVQRARPRLGWRVLLLAAALLLAAMLLFLATLRGSGESGLRALSPNSVGAIDPERARIVAQIPTGGPPYPVVAGEGGIWTLTDDGAVLVHIDVQTKRATTYAIGAEAVDIDVGAGAVWILHAPRGEEGPTFAANAQLSRFDPEVRGFVEERLATGHDFNLEDRLGVGLGGVWVTHAAGPGPGRDVLFRIDPATGANRFDVPVGEAVELAVDANAVWILHSRSRVDRVDAESGALEATIELGQGFAPQSMSVGLGAVWVAAASVKDCPPAYGPTATCPTGNNGAIFRIDPLTNTVAAKVAVASAPAGIAVADGAVWLADSGTGSLQRIDPLANRVVQTISLGTSVGGVAVSDALVWVGAQ